MAGREISQKRKKHIKSLVLVPDDAGMVFAISSAISLWRCVLRPRVQEPTDIVQAWPYRPQHDLHAVSADAGLDTIPNTTNAISRRSTKNASI